MAELFAQSARKLSRMIAARDVSVSEVMAAHLDRIDAVNPAVNAIVSLRDRDALMEEARAADGAERKGWMHGLPVAIKDLVDAEGFVTSQGSPIYAGDVAKRDAATVARIKAAGAIIICKTNVPEFGVGSHTYNPVFGTTANPYAADRTAGGSSGGAAAALATRMVPVADGSDMMGSLRNPAGWNNVYALRPTWGRVPEDPEGDTYLHRISTDGPMARSPSDVLALMTTLGGRDARWPGPGWPDLPGQIAPQAAGLRIGWLADWGGAWPVEAGVLDLCETALAVMADLGADVDTMSPPIPAETLWDSWTTLRAFSVGVKKADLFRDPAARARLKPEVVFEIERGLSLTPEAIQSASVARSGWLRTAIETFDSWDVLVLPTAQCFPFDKDLTWPREIAGVAMDSYHRWMEAMVPAALIGLPVMAVPAGFSEDGLPMGLQLIGKPGDDARLIALAEAYHAATGWPDRRPPDL